MMLGVIMILGMVAACAPATPAAPGAPVAPGADPVAPVIGADLEDVEAAEDGGALAIEGVEGAQVLREIQIIKDNNVPVSINPHNPASAVPSTGWNLTMIHDRLIERDPLTGNFLPGLAYDYETDDYQHFIFNLRQGVTFHNGDPFTAEDVVFTVESAQSTHAIGSWAAAAWNPVETARAIDNYTLEIILDDIDVDFIFQLTRPASGILNPRAVSADRETGAWIGTGAFQVVEFVSSDFVLLHRNENWWGGLPPTEVVRLRFVPDMATRTIMMQTGEAHLSFGTPVEDMDYFIASPNFETFSTTSNDPQGMQFNMNDPITGCYYFRRAVAHAICRTEIAFGSAGMWADGNIFGSYWGLGTEFRNENIQLPERDLDLARQYLERSVYNGEDVEIIVAIATFVRSATIIQMQLAEIGINIVINETDIGGISANAVFGGDHQMVVFFTLITPSAGSARDAFRTGGGQNRASFSDPRVDYLLDTARTIGDVATRRAMYEEVQEIVSGSLAFQGLFWRVFGNVRVPELGGIILHPDPGSHDFRGIFVNVE